MTSPSHVDVCLCNDFIHLEVQAMKIMTTCPRFLYQGHHLEVWITPPPKFDTHNPPEKVTGPPINRLPIPSSFRCKLAVRFRELYLNWPPSTEVILTILTLPGYLGTGRICFNDFVGVISRLPWTSYHQARFSCPTSVEVKKRRFFRQLSYGKTGVMSYITNPNIRHDFFRGKCVKRILHLPIKVDSKKK